MKFKYVGPHDAVELVGHGEVKHGATVEVTGDAAKALAEQPDTWKRVMPARPSKKKTAPKSGNENEE